MGNFWDNDPVAPARAPSTALPNSGDPTSFSPQGNAAGLVTPGRISDDTLFALGLNAAEGGKNSASILNNDPGSTYQHNFALRQSDNDAAINMKQKMTMPMLGIIHGMREKLNAANPGIADMATGPNYGQLSDDPSTLEYMFKAPLPDTSGEFYQNARAAVRNAINLPGQYIPGISSITQPMADAGNQARDLNLELHHLTKGIGAGVKAIPGVKGGGTSTDADQALVLDAVGEAMHSADEGTRNSILYDAENILRARAGMSALPPPANYKPTYISAKYGDASSGSPSSPAPGASQGQSPDVPQVSSPNAGNITPDMVPLTPRPTGPQTVQMHARGQSSGVPGISIGVPSAPIDAATKAQTIIDARKALAAGADRGKVLQRLKDLGITAGQ